MGIIFLLLGLIISHTARISQSSTVHKGEEKEEENRKNIKLRKREKAFAVESPEALDPEHQGRYSKEYRGKE